MKKLIYLGLTILLIADPLLLLLILDIYITGYLSYRLIKLGWGENISLSKYLHKYTIRPDPRATSTVSKHFWEF